MVSQERENTWHMKDSMPCPCRLLHDDMKESGLLPVVGRLLKSFSFAFQPRSHAMDLVETLHVILRMLDRLNASGQPHNPLRPRLLRVTVPTSCSLACPARPPPASPFLPPSRANTQPRLAGSATRKIEPLNLVARAVCKGS